MSLRDMLVLALLDRDTGMERKLWHWPKYNNNGCKCAKTTERKIAILSKEGRQEKNCGVNGRYGSAARSLKERLVRSRLQRAGYVERMADDRLQKRAAELREEGRRRRGRPRLRWEDCVKRDVRKAGEEEEWKKKTRDRGGWKRLSDVIRQWRSCGQHLIHDKGKKRKEEIFLHNFLMKIEIF